MAQRLKRLPAMQEIWVQSLGWEDPLEKEMATHSSILAWRISWTEEPGGLQSTGSQSRTQQSYFTFTVILVHVLQIFKKSNYYTQSVQHSDKLVLFLIEQAYFYCSKYVTHLVIYIFQCYSLKSSHPCLPPLSPKVCSLHLCLLCCPAHRMIRTIFLDSIYMC